MQIKRLTNEKRFLEDSIETAKQYQRYKDGEITYSKYSEINNDLNEEDEIIRNDTDEIKQDVLSYLDAHPDLKDIIQDLDIDEDFYQKEYGGSSGDGRVYFK